MMRVVCRRLYIPTTHSTTPLNRSFESCLWWSCRKQAMLLPYLRRCQWAERPKGLKDSCCCFGVPAPYRNATSCSTSDPFAHWARTWRKTLLHCGIKRHIAATSACVKGSETRTGGEVCECIGYHSTLISSLTGAVELRNSLAAQFSVELPPSLALDFPTVSAIAAHISGLISMHVSSDEEYLAESSFVSTPVPLTASRSIGGLLQLAAAENTETGVPAVAIVGMSARFPGGVRDPAGFWAAISACADLPSLVRVFLSWRTA